MKIQLQNIQFRRRRRCSSSLLFRRMWNQQEKFYATDEELIHDIGVAYQDVIRQFYEAGCRNLQLDDCTWGAVVGDAAKQRYKKPWY